MMFETELARDESRWLIVSDNPEQLSFTAGGGATKQWLYNVAIELASYPNPRFRVLVWHENDTTEAKYVHVVAQAAGQKCEITSHHQQVSIQSTGAVSAIGRCIAKAQLFGSLEADSSGNGTVPVGGYHRISSQLVGAGQTIGAVHEFSVEGEGGVLTIGTVWSNQAQDYTATAMATAQSNMHCRGSWPWCGVRATLLERPIEQPIGNTPIILAEASIGMFNDAIGKETELFVFRSTADDPNQAGYEGNLGLYGVDLDLSYKVRNVGQSPIDIYSSLAAWNSGATPVVVGAIQIGSQNWGFGPVRYLDEEELRLGEWNLLPNGVAEITHKIVIAGPTSLPAGLRVTFTPD